MIKFGTGGWRAVIGEDFTKENVERIAKSICIYIWKNNLTSNPVAIGYDNRFLSKEASRWISDELLKNGINSVVFTESVPTPYLMWYVQDNNYDIGLMVTASHNPYNYNGIKVIVKDGKDASVEVTSELETFCDDNFKMLNCCMSEPSVIEIPPKYVEYVAFINKLLPPENRVGCNSHIIFNPMHGSGLNAFKFACNLPELDIFNGNIDPYFSHKLPAPNIDSLSDIIDMYKNGQIKDSIVISFDGDGDRLGVIDENGNYVDMNKLMTLFYWYLHEYRNQKGSIIKNCVTSSMLDNIAKYYNEECIEVPVGFKYISEGMKKYDALIGGESSGGATFRNYINGKDAIFSATLLLEILSITQNKLYQLINMMDKNFGGKTFCESSIKYEKRDIESIREFVSFMNNDITMYVTNSGKMIHYYTIDGHKWIFKNGDWISIRFSGTEPIIRVMGEFDDTTNWDNALNNFKYELNNIIK